jgi:AcrR family transcriptional regulator
MSRIADRAGVSKSVLYHYYDSKDDLLRELLDETLATFHEAERLDGGDDRAGGSGDGCGLASESRLVHLVEAALAEPFPGDVAGSDSTLTTPFVRAYVELRARAAHDPQYRELFTETEESLREEFADCLAGADGADGPDLAAADGDHASELLLTLVQGLVFQRVTTDSVALDAVRGASEDHLSPRDGAAPNDDDG